MTLWARLALPLAAAFLACAPAPAHAQPVAAAAAPDPERQAKGLRLARAVQPREVAVEQSLATLDRQMVGTLLSDPEIKAMEEEHPGIVSAMYVAIRPILATDLEKSLPDLWSALARVYARGLTAPQLDESAIFFESGTGRKFLMEMTRNMDVKTVTKDVLGPGDGTIGAGSYTEAIEGAAGATVEALTPAERAQLNRFMMSPTGKALERIAPEVMRVGLAWMNRPEPDSEARVQAAMIATVEAFIEGKSEPARKRKK